MAANMMRVQCNSIPMRSSHWRVRCRSAPVLTGESSKPRLWRSSNGCDRPDDARGDVDGRHPALGAGYADRVLQEKAADGEAHNERIRPPDRVHCSEGLADGAEVIGRRPHRIRTSEAARSAWSRPGSFLPGVSMNRYSTPSAARASCAAGIWLAAGRVSSSMSLASRAPPSSCGALRIEVEDRDLAPVLDCLPSSVTA